MVFEDGNIRFFVYYQNWRALYIFNDEIIYNKEPGIMDRRHNVGNANSDERYHLHYLAKYIKTHISTFPAMDLVDSIEAIEGFKPEKGKEFQNSIVTSSDEYDNANSMQLQIIPYDDDVCFQVDKLILDNIAKRDDNGKIIVYKCHLSYFDALITLCNLLISPQVWLTYEYHYEKVREVKFGSGNLDKFFTALKTRSWMADDQLRAYKSYLSFTKVYLNWLERQIKDGNIDLGFLCLRSGFDLHYLFSTDVVQDYIHGLVDWLTNSMVDYNSSKFAYAIFVQRGCRRMIDDEYYEKLDKYRLKVPKLWSSSLNKKTRTELIAHLDHILWYYHNS